METQPSPTRMPVQTTTKLSVQKLRDWVERIQDVIYGQKETVTLCCVGLLAEGHILLEDVPGTGKTTLARALAKSVSAQFRRIQFTSDLLPADVIGVTVYSPTDGGFEFREGPIFGNIILADELNRTTPRTQSALLEAMNERSVSIEGEPRPLPHPFLVVATQNPLEFEGTYPLPESQLDRFLLRLRMGYPSREAERRVLTSRIERDPLADLEPALRSEELATAIRAVRTVRIDDALVDYVLDFIAATRKGSRFLLGASPRASLGWLRAAQAHALLQGRNYCVPDDVKRLALPVLSHRVVPAPGAGPTDASLDADEALAELAEKIDVPE